MTPDQQAVFITGCSSGIGYHLALAFYNKGFQVFATARRADSISDLAAKGIETLSLVVNDPESVQACYKELCKRLGDRKLCYLVNNAGRGYVMPAADLDLGEVQDLFSTNVFAVMHINQVFLPLLLKAKGTIVHTGSIAGTMPYVWGPAYCSSKAALHAYADTLRVELAPFGVHVLSLITGGVKSQIARTDRVLPAHSLWSSYRQEFNRRVKHSQEVGMDTQAYANQVVKATLGARGWLWNRNEIWAGSYANITWFINIVDRWIPGGIYRFIMPFEFGFKRTIEPPESFKGR